MFGDPCYRTAVLKPTSGLQLDFLIGCGKPHQVLFKLPGCRAFTFIYFFGESPPLINENTVQLSLKQAEGH